MKIKMLLIIILIIFEIININSKELVNINNSIQENNNTGESKLNLISGQLLNTYSTLWGWNGSFEMGTGTRFPRMEPIQISSENWISVAAGDQISFGIKSDSTLWVWGSNKFGQFGDGSLGDTLLIPKQIGNDKNWKFITVSRKCVYAIKNDCSLWAWGINDFGTLGDSTTISRFIPAQIGKYIFGKVKCVSASETVISAITEDGYLWTWGRNKNGALGDGTNIDHYHPVKIDSTGGWMAVSSGVLRTFAIKTDGSLWGWGENSSGALGEGTKINQSSPIQIGSESDWSAISNSEDCCIALKTNGTMWCWGYNNDGKLGDTLIKFIAKPLQMGVDKDWLFINNKISMRSEAVKKDSTLWYWGSAPWLRKPKPEAILKPTKVPNIGNITQLSGNSYWVHSFFLRNYKATLATIETLPITKITSNSAESGGNITSPGSEVIYQRGVCYDLKSNPKIDKNITEDGTDVGEFQTTLKNLLPFKKYFVRAYVRTAAGDSYGGEESIFTKLATPVLISPQQNALDIPLNVSFVWEKDMNAIKYRIQLSKYVEFNSLIFDKEVTDTIYDHKDLELQYVYYWRVQTINGVFTSEWSEINSFHTIKFNEQTLITPKQDDINVPIDCKLNWDPNTKSSSYISQVSKYDSLDDFILDTILTNNSFALSKLDYLQSYYWRIRSFYGTDSSGWSPVWKFTTLMDSIKLTSPENLSSNLSLSQNLIWEKGIYDKNNRLQIAKDNNFSNIIFDTLLNKKYDVTINNLKKYTKYFWRVRNESGDTLGYWSPIWQFKTRMSDVLLVYPDNNKTGLEQKIKFIWGLVSGAEFYHLQISKNEFFTDIVYSEDSVKTTEHNVPDLELNTLYYWRVRPWNADSKNAIYWSEVWSFRTGNVSVKDKEPGISIVPNPAGDFITISLSGTNPTLKHGVAETSEILFYNTLGEKVMTVETLHATSLQINISDFPKGMYFVKVGNETAKFVKM